MWPLAALQIGFNGLGDGVEDDFEEAGEDVLRGLIGVEVDSDVCSSFRAGDLMRSPVVAGIKNSFFTRKVPVGSARDFVISAAVTRHADKQAVIRIISAYLLGKSKSVSNDISSVIKNPSKEVNLFRRYKQLYLQASLQFI